MTARRALVIGGSGMIGGAIAQRLRRDNYEVVTADLQGADRRVDVTDQSSVRDLIGSVGDFNCLVNAFGVTSKGSFETISADEWDRVQATNLRGVFFACHAVLPALRRSGGGRIVNIGSVLAKNGGNPRPWLDPAEQQHAANAAYGAAKAGVHALTLYLAKELASEGITVNAVAPGPIAGPMTTGFPSSLVDQIPLRRLGTPEEVAAAVAWLCSEDAAYVTGEIVDINGGLWPD